MAINPSTMRLGIVAIVVGLAGAYGVRWMMQEEEAPPEVKQDDMRVVPLANTELPADRPVQIGDIALVPMTQKMIEQRNWPLRQVMMSSDQIIGRRPAKPVRLGEPFLTTDMHLSGWTEDINALLKPGFRAYSIRVSDEQGGIAKQGDIVDVIFRSEAKVIDGVPVPETTKLLVEAVEVIRVKRPTLTALQNVVGYNAQDPTVTLALEPREAQILQTAEPHGDISLTIRAANDTLKKGLGLEGEGMDILGLLGIERPEEPGPEPPPAPPKPPQLVELVKGGSRGVEQFPRPGTPWQLVPEQREEYKRQRQMEMIQRQLQELAAQGLIEIDDEGNIIRKQPKQPDQVAGGQPIGNVTPDVRNDQQTRRPTVQGPSPMGYPTPKKGMGMGMAPGHMGMGNGIMGMDDKSDDKNDPFKDDEPMTLEVMP